MWVQRGVPALWEEQEQLSGLLGLLGLQGHAGETDPESPGEVRAGIPLSLLPGGPRAPQKRRCQGMPVPPAPTWHVQCPGQEFSRLGSMRVQSGELRTLREQWWVGTKQAQCCRLPTTSHCTGGPQETSTNTVGTRKDSHRKSLTLFTPMELQI